MKAKNLTVSRVNKNPARVQPRHSLPRAVQLKRQSLIIYIHTAIAQ